MQSLIETDEVVTRGEEPRFRGKEHQVGWVRPSVCAAAGDYWGKKKYADKHLSCIFFLPPAALFMHLDCCVARRTEAAEE